MRRTLLALLPAALLALGAPTARAQDPVPPPRNDWQVLVDARQPEVVEVVERLRAHRESQGLATLLQEVTTPARPETVQGWVRHARPRFLLLVGDVDMFPAWSVQHPGVEEAVATDRPYGDLDGDGYPEVSVGRIPSGDTEVVRRVVERIIRYEAETAPGPWRRECALLAGEGGFSPQIDAIIESLFARVVSEAIAPGYSVDLTYANPSSRYCYPPHQFASRVIDRFNEGALVYAYVGHGQVTSVDDLDVKGPGGVKRYPVLGVDQVPQLSADARRAPILLAIACWTGKFEGDRPCIGEELMAAEGGPVAFYGSSRVSHPVHNALLAKALVGQLLAGTGQVRLGSALDAAEREMVRGRAAAEPAAAPDPIRIQVLTLARAFLGGEAVDREMPRHVDMYNLLGDPALVLARPEAEVAIEAAERATAGEALEVKGRVRGEGATSVTVTLETERTRVARPDGPQGETPVERYARANDQVVWTELAPVAADGTFTVTLQPPRGLPAGRYWVKAFAQGRRCGLGAAAVEVVAPEGYDPFEEEDGWEGEEEEE